MLKKKKKSQNLEYMGKNRRSLSPLLPHACPARDNVLHMDQRCSDDGRLLGGNCLCRPGGCTETSQLFNCPLQGMIQSLFLLIAQCFPFVLLKFYSELGHKGKIQLCDRIIRCCRDGGRNESMTASSVQYHIFFNVTLFKLLFSN